MENGTCNLLERAQEIPQRSGKPNPRPKVTIAIGLISKRSRWGDGEIVLACDSQTTYPDGQTRSDAQKLNVIEFANARILVAQSGAAELADKAIENMQRLAKDRTVENCENVTGVAKTAIRQIRDHFIELNKIKSDDAKRIFFREEEHSFSLLLAFYFQGKPYIYSIDIEWCLEIPVKTSFKAIGVAWRLGEFLLKEYKRADPDFEYGDLIAAAIVEKVIENNGFCGRPTWIGIAFNVIDSARKSDAFIYTRKITAAIVQQIQEQESQLLPKKKEELENFFRDFHQKFGLVLYSEPGATKLKSQS